MAKQNLLLVDGDMRSLRLLEASLKKAGYQVDTATNGVDALDKLEIVHPDLIISDAHMNEMDGFELYKRLKQNPDWTHIPLILLTDKEDNQDKIHGLELGVDDCLSKPIYLKEIVGRVQILLEKNQHRSDQSRGPTVRTQFHGHLQDMAVVDLIQTIEIGRKSGVIHFEDHMDKTGVIYFRNGKVIDAESGRLNGEEAVYRLLSWTDGKFNVDFKSIQRPEAIELSSQGLLMEGMRRLDEWGRLCEQIPTLDSRLEIDTQEVSERLKDITPEAARVLKLFDGKRSIMDVVDEYEGGDLEGLNVIVKLYFEGLITLMNAYETKIEPDWKIKGSVSSRAYSLSNSPDNVIQFSRPEAPPSKSINSQRMLPRTTLTRAQAIAPNPNDLLEPVAGETLHVAQPEPLIRNQPTIIIQDPSLKSEPVQQANIPEPVLELDLINGVPSYRDERTARVEPQASRLVTPMVRVLEITATVAALGTLVGVLLFQINKTLHIKETSSNMSRSSAKDQDATTPAPRSVIKVPDTPSSYSAKLHPQIVIKKRASERVTSPWPQREQNQSYDALATQARSAYAHGSYLHANQLAVQALSLRPNSAAMMALQALIALELGDNNRTAALATQAIIVEPDTADAYLALGTLDLAKQRTTDARQHFERYLSLAPRGTHAAEIRAVLRNIP